MRKQYNKPEIITRNILQPNEAIATCELDAINDWWGNGWTGASEDPYNTSTTFQEAWEDAISNPSTMSDIEKAVDVGHLYLFYYPVSESSGYLLYFEDFYKYEHSVYDEQWNEYMEGQGIENYLERIEADNIQHRQTVGSGGTLPSDQTLIGMFFHS